MFGRVWSQLVFVWYTVCLLAGVLAMGFALTFASTSLLDHGQVWMFLGFLLIAAVLATICYGMFVFLALYWNRLRRRGQMSRFPERLARVLIKIMDSVMAGI